MRVGFVARSWLILVIRWYASRCATPYSKCSKFVACRDDPIPDGRLHIIGVGDGDLKFEGFSKRSDVVEPHPQTGSEVMLSICGPSVERR